MESTSLSEVQLKILQVKKFPIWDIFVEDGWLNWSRYLFKKDKLIYLAGNKLVSKSLLQQITKHIKDASH